MFSVTHFLPRLASSCAWTAMVTFGLTLPVSVQAQTPAPRGANTPQPTNPALNTLSPSTPTGSRFSLQGGQTLLSEAESAIATQNYTQAINKLQEARQVFNQLSNSYQQLSASFLAIDNRVSSTLRSKALDTAQKRDQATYQLALVYRSQNQPQQAVPLFVQIIQSQQPTRDLGQKSYQQLLELGFVDAPFTPQRNPRPAPPRSPAPAAPQQPSQPK